ncbi:MAG: ATP synthase subunit C [Clostridiales bacterium]|jgi:V/A-type H+-transporting ATPase subunit K|nr:ATP synthase subunit C [Clostridiales bacterium]
MTLTQLAILAVLILSVTAPLMVYYNREKHEKREKNPDKGRRFKRALAVNVVLFALALIGGTMFAFSGAVQASELAEAAGAAVSSPSGLAFIGAALSTGMSSIAAGIATGQAASAALGALSENEGIMGKALIFVALAEGIAIYGLIISFMILNQA